LGELCCSIWLEVLWFQAYVHFPMLAFQFSDYWKVFLFSCSHSKFSNLSIFFLQPKLHSVFLLFHIPFDAPPILKENHRLYN
jgi:hypothetical protein